MKSVSKHQTAITQRQQATAAAIASVRAEGIELSSSTHSRLLKYANGNIPLHQLRSETLAEAQALGAKTKGV